jgi:hypothetical protein
MTDAGMQPADSHESAHSPTTILGCRSKLSRLLHPPTTEHSLCASWLCPSSIRHLCLSFRSQELHSSYATNAPPRSAASHTRSRDACPAATPSANQNPTPQAHQTVPGDRHSHSARRLATLEPITTRCCGGTLAGWHKGPDQLDDDALWYSNPSQAYNTAPHRLVLSSERREACAMCTADAYMSQASPSLMLHLNTAPLLQALGQRTPAPSSWEGGAPPASQALASEAAGSLATSAGATALRTLLRSRYAQSSPARTRQAGSGCWRRALPRAGSGARRARPMRQRSSMPGCLGDGPAPRAAPRQHGRRRRMHAAGVAPPEHTRATHQLGDAGGHLPIPQQQLGRSGVAQLGLQLRRRLHGAEHLGHGLGRLRAPGSPPPPRSAAPRGAHGCRGSARSRRWGGGSARLLWGSARAPGAAPRRVAGAWQSCCLAPMARGSPTSKPTPLPLNPRGPPTRDRTAAISCSSVSGTSWPSASSPTTCTSWMDPSQASITATSPAAPGAAAMLML